MLDGPERFSATAEDNCVRSGVSRKAALHALGGLRHTPLMRISKPFGAIVEQRSEYASAHLSEARRYGLKSEGRAPVPSVGCQLRVLVPGVA